MVRALRHTHMCSRAPGVGHSGVVPARWSTRRRSGARSERCLPLARLRWCVHRAPRLTQSSARRRCGAATALPERSARGRDVSLAVAFTASADTDEGEMSLVCCHQEKLHDVDSSLVRVPYHS